MDVEVRGLDDLQKVTKALRAAGDQGKGLKKEFYAGLNRATKEVRADMKANIPGALPSRGGLADEVARTTSLTTSATGSGRNPGVRIRARGRRAIARMNRTGSFRHPVFGNKNVWVEQTAGVTKGFLDEPFEKSKPHLQDAVIDAIAAVARMIDRRV